MEEKRIVLKVSKETAPVNLGSAIVRKIEEGEKITVRAIGVEAVNQAVKGIATAVCFSKEKGKRIYFIPYFSNIDFNGETKKAIEFDVEEV